ncbi:MAG TPA: pyridoxamine 5'-phosphate oxidase family protein [Gemmatimonadales bacterium]|nr:pyridoxamine 5'-phosphate oxidase family protein [Gemmatimonadales bacterium]
MSPTVYQESTPSPRSTVRVHPDREATEEAAEFLAAGHVAHVGFEVDGQPYVIPMTYQFDPAAPGYLYLHGGHHSRLIEHLAGGAPVCVTVTMVDGLVYSRSALFHSVNYRSVVCFCRAAPPPALEQRRALLDGMIARYFPGRVPGRDYEAASDGHLEATAFVALAIEEWSAKVRRGGPKGPRDTDPIAWGSAGVISTSVL